MYPDWPKSDADLVPLPLCDGPKLKAFDFHGPQDIEFLEKIGKGAHSNVFKVKILDQIFALKLFTFLTEYNFHPKVPDIPDEDHEAFCAMAQHAEPFNAECRAFGRLKEAGHEELGVACYGYVLLDEKHERLMAEMSTELDWVPDQNIQKRFPRTEEGSYRRPPIRGIVKAFGQRMDVNKLQDRDCRKYLRDIWNLHKLGIVLIDLDWRQLVDSRHADFSTAITTPHFAVSPELSPGATPAQLLAMENTAFYFTIKDYLNFDALVKEHQARKDNSRPKHCPEDCPEDYPEDCPQHCSEDCPELADLSIYAFPQYIDPWDHHYYDKSSRHLRVPRHYGLRDQPQRLPLWTYVDPRQYDWRKSWARSQTNGTTRGRTSSTRDKRIKKTAGGNTARGKTSGLSRRSPVKLTIKPRWILKREGVTAVQFHTWNGEYLDGHFVVFFYRGGTFVPIETDHPFRNIDVNKVDFTQGSVGSD